MLELMRLARQHQARALIADNRLLRALRQADLQWSGDLVLKGLSELGGRRLAAVESLDAMNRMGITALVGTFIPNTQLTSHFLRSLKKPGPGLPPPCRHRVAREVPVETSLALPT